MDLIESHSCKPFINLTFLKMGVRISSVVILRRVLSWLSEYVSTCVSNPDSLLSTHHLYASSAEGELSNSLSYCEHGPSLDGVPHGSEGMRQLKYH